jgi:hypothetical protein
MPKPMGDEEITLEIKYHVIKAKQGKLKRARLEWQASGIKIYVVGSLAGHLYEQAANLAMNLCEARHIPAGSLRRAK